MRPTPLSLFAFCALCWFPLRAQTPAPSASWEKESLLLYSESAAEFARLRSVAPRDNRALEYMETLDALHASARTAENVEAARVSLGRIVEMEPDDPVGLASRYFLARLEQVHADPPDLERAKQLYLDLFEARKDSFFGQLSYIKYLTLAIYDELGSEQTPLERIRAVKERAAEITIPPLAQNAHRMLGDAYMAFELEPSSALYHYELALGIGIPLEPTRVEVLQSAARLAEELDRPEDAAAWYAELAQAERDPARKATYRQAVARLRKSP